jgi:hypothetical protein
MTDMAWREAIIRTLRGEGGAMHYTAIAEGIVADGLRKTVGATPASTVAAIISMSLRDEGEDSPFLRVRRGEYILRAQADDEEETNWIEGDEEEGIGEEKTPIQALGMFWDRSLVKWSFNTAILGRQQMGADAVDMSEQRGVYLLHDVREVVYVGRATERSLARRLYEHTFDRLKTRWNRFSWFGICPVNDDGSLGEPGEGFGTGDMIGAMEALLIEALEPPQNRKRGDGFAGVEYIQAEDPEIEKANLLALMAELQKRL